MTVQILVGDSLAMLKTLPDASVHTCVTSPPYYGLRDYGVDGQIGLEKTPQEFIDKLVAAFRAVRRVLRNDGTCWVNMGDSYAGSWGAQSREHAGKHAPNISALSANQVIAAQRRETGTGSIPSGSGLKPKDLMGMPWMLAFALRADGWYLRQDIIWHKPNPMPESVTDRCTKSHEYIFLLSKSERYFYDFDAMQEPCSDNTHARLPGNVRPAKSAQAHIDGAEEHRTKAGLHAFAEKQRAKYKTPDGWDTTKGEGGHGSYHKDGREKGRKLADAGSGTKNNTSFDEAMAVMPETRNRRSVWTVSTQSFKEAHFATFPPALIEPCILAGCPAGGTVLDPFFGAGTTGLVADRLQRNCVGIELNPQYAEMARKRINGDSPLFAAAQ